MENNEKIKNKKIMFQLLTIIQILITIILSAGLIFFISQRCTKNSYSLNEQEQLAFNSKFTSYEGNQKGHQVNALAQVVLTNNQVAKESGTTDETGISLHGEITINADGSSASFNKVPAENMYTVNFSYKNGLINSIEIRNKK